MVPIGRASVPADHIHCTGETPALPGFKVQL